MHVIFMCHCFLQEKKKRGVIAASAGNHALALAWHGTQLNIPVTVVMPTIAPLTKAGGGCRSMPFDPSFVLSLSKRKVTEWSCQLLLSREEAGSLATSIEPISFERSIRVALSIR